MNNKTTNNHNNNNNNISNNNNNNNFNISSQQSTPTRSTRHQEEREIEQRRQRHHILLMKSNKMLKRCCCYMLILSLGVLMSPLLPPKVEATAVAFVGEALAVVTTDAPPPKRLGAAATAASVEMLQLPHAFRHEEHYSHRIEQAVNDFKRAQMQKLKERDKNEEKDKNQTTKAPPAPLARPTLNNNNDNSNNNNKNRNDLFQWQMEPHHRRHEQHYLQHNNNQQQPHSHEQKQKQHQQQEQQQQHSLEHHLRHSNGRFKHLEENIIALPPMRHQRHQMQQQQHNKQHKNQPFNNFDSFNFDSNIQPNSNQRLSFQLKTDNFEQNFDDESSSISDDETDAAVNNKNDSANSSDESSSSDDDDSDDDEEYSYEDESDESTFGNSFRRRSSNSYSAIDGKAASVKRYTNPFKNFRTSAVSSSKKRWNLLDEQRESNKNKLKKIDDDSNSNSNTNGSSNDSNDDDDDDQANDGHGNDEDSNNFTNEKWHKIESEHHRRQLQHQREMQALRLRHSPNGLKNQQKIHNERHFKNEDPLETDSIFSRNYIPGTLTRHKIQELGTAEAVLETRRTHATKHKKNRELANAHVKQIISEAACRIPQRRVERIQLDPAKTYTPHCTILHRCADDTGCCRSERQTCAPKVTQNVDLYFFVKDMKERRPTIERLTFINHTECHCVDRAQRLPDEYHNSVGSFSAAGHELTLRRATILNCNCPKLFEKILQEDGYCRCDCSSGNTGCDWLKRGMEHFSMIDRKCMLEGRCKPPTCEYGTYLKKHGRCPRREEQLAYTLSGNNGGISASYSSNFSPSYSSAAAAGTSLSALTTNSLH